MRYVHAVKRAFKRAFTEDQITDSAAAITYYAFLSIPSLLLVAVGFFSLFATPDTVVSLVERLSGVIPESAVELLSDTLARVVDNRGGGIVMVAVGFLVAGWTVSGAMGAVIRALNQIYGRLEGRGFVGQRAAGLVLVLLLVAAFALVFGLLVLGPYVSRWTGIGWIWWVAQWPILIGGLLAAFALVYAIGPNRDRQRGLLSAAAGAAVAVAVWLAASGGFAFYASNFGSYNKAWGSIAVVIIMLTWLWLSSLALLLGAELDADLEGARGEDAAEDADEPQAAERRETTSISGRGRDRGRAERGDAAVSGTGGGRDGERR